MNSKRFLSAVTCALALSFCAATTAAAATINVTYSLTGSGGGDPLNPPLIGTRHRFTPSTWKHHLERHDFPRSGHRGRRRNVQDDVHGWRHPIWHCSLRQGDFSTFPIVPFTQLLTVTGGTGALLLYHGTLTGLEISNQLDGTFTSSGAGTLDTAPEPESIVLLGTGLAGLLAYRKRALLFQQDRRKHFGSC